MDEKVKMALHFGEGQKEVDWRQVGWEELPDELKHGLRVECE